MSNGSSRRKGKAAELEVVHFLQEHGVPAHRLWEDQSKPGGQKDGDIGIDLPGWEGVHHIEVRRRERLDIPRWLVEIDEKAGAQGQWPLLIVRKNRMDWWACIKLEQLIEHWRGAE